jgi:hypothetical protein
MNWHICMSHSQRGAPFGGNQTDKLLLKDKLKTLLELLQTDNLNITQSGTSIIPNRPTPMRRDQ